MVTYTVQCVITVCNKRRMEAWRMRNPEKVRQIGREYSYGLTPSQFDRLKRLQGNKCPLCRQEFSSKVKPYVDHDHSCCTEQKTCGKCIRGLLCNKCNAVLGRVEKFPMFLQDCKAYLKKHTRQKENIALYNVEQS